MPACVVYVCVYVCRCVIVNFKYISLHGKQLCNLMVAKQQWSVRERRTCLRNSVDVVCNSITCQ